MKYLENYQDFKLDKSEKSEINDIFHSTISGDDV